MRICETNITWNLDDLNIEVKDDFLGFIQNPDAIRDIEKFDNSVIDMLFFAEGSNLDAILGWHRIWDDEETIQVAWLEYSAEEEAKLVDLDILQIRTMTDL